MKNRTTIIGDKNTVIQNAKKSDIEIDTSHNKPNKNNSYVIISIAIGIIGVLVSVIIGWDSILKFFNIQ